MLMLRCKLDLISPTKKKAYNTQSAAYQVQIVLLATTSAEEIKEHNQNVGTVTFLFTKEKQIKYLV